MREWPEFPVGRGAAALLRLYPHQYPWGESCALTVSLLLGFAEAAHDSVLRNDISEHTVVCGLRESRGECALLMHIAPFLQYGPWITFSYDNAW